MRKTAAKSVKLKIGVRLVSSVNDTVLERNSDVAPVKKLKSDCAGKRSSKRSSAGGRKQIENTGNMREEWKNV